MPLYTYIASYRGGTHADQDRRSNFKGSAALLLGRMPDGALPYLSKELRTDMVHKAFRCEWTAIPNRSNLWRTAFDLGGHEFALYAIQTER